MCETKPEAMQSYVLSRSSTSPSGRGDANLDVCAAQNVRYPSRNHGAESNKSLPLPLDRHGESHPAMRVRPMQGSKKAEKPRQAEIGIRRTVTR